MRPLDRIAGLRWPAPALLAWAAGWLVWYAAAPLAAPVPAWIAATAAGIVTGWGCADTRRRAIAGAGFPLSSWVLGAAAHLPPWVWLLAALPLFAAYPLRAWRDAPFFPTPAAALAGLDAIVGRPRRILDAGCGLGHGLAALRRLWPEAELAGIEWSAPLAWLAARRCRGARIERGDMWQRPWSGQDLVYLFQRPESMARAWAKADRELDPGAWLVSLEFEVPGRTASARLEGPGRRPVWIYRKAGASPQASRRSTGAYGCR
ncbi:MAG: class I SAM-dependent methyltransferase [Burkholderiales bacterium]|nr:class I SAM-dependent methyltransferase [Burkholderiales bacterium]MDE1927208.1 class I SAM-dependent methyltransferase [Burkholderiales bacterium]MDE2502145.1 class I SAM-dependent methyltransferase [Burkholderiales bacterium]